MKAIVCEMCGSQDLVKKDGMYVCQNCGTKYDPEEAKKLMVEVSGNVTVQGVATVDGIIENALNTFNQGNYEEAYRLFTDALNLQPNHPRATLYRGLSAGALTTVEKPRLDEACTAAIQALKQAKIEYDPVLFVTFLLEVSLQLANVMKSGNQLFDDYTQKLNGINPAEYSSSDQQYLQNVKRETIFKRLNIATSANNVIDTLDSVITNDLDIPDLVCHAVLALLQTATFCITFVSKNRWEMNLDATKKRLRIIDKLKIDETKPESYRTAMDMGKNLVESSEYKSDADWESVSSWAQKYNAQRPSETKSGLNEVYQSQKSGGCYVATAVYGSYDCPQVWTLRRYRDYTLAESWYGRSFIRTYYAISPTLVKWFGETDWFKNMWKPKLDRMVKELNDKGVADTPYQDKSW